MGRHVAVMLVLALGGIEPIVAQDVPGVTPGCYRLEVGDWTPPRSAGNEPYQTPPTVITLLDSVGDAYFERGRKLVRPVIPRGRTPSAFWEPLRIDSVRVLWTNGFAGVRMRLWVTSDGLQGTAEAFTDVRTPELPDSRTSVVGHLVPCPSAGTDGRRGGARRSAGRTFQGRGRVTATRKDLVFPGSRAVLTALYDGRASSGFERSNACRIDGAM